VQQDQQEQKEVQPKTQTLRVPQFVKGEPRKYNFDVKLELESAKQIHFLTTIDKLKRL